MLYRPPKFFEVLTQLIKEEVEEDEHGAHQDDEDEDKVEIHFEKLKQLRNGILDDGTSKFDPQKDFIRIVRLMKAHLKTVFMKE